MANLMKVTVSVGKEVRDVLLNLDQIVAVELIEKNVYGQGEPYPKVKHLSIVTAGRDIDGVITYSITEEPYALAVFEKMSSWARDCSWQSLIGKQQD